MYMQCNYLKSSKMCPHPPPPHTHRHPIYFPIFSECPGVPVQALDRGVHRQDQGGVQLPPVPVQQVCYKFFLLRFLKLQMKGKLIHLPSIYSLTNSLTHSIICPHKALVSHLKLVPGFRVCYYLMEKNLCCTN